MSEGNADQERMWATFCHLASLSAYVGVPFGNIIGPLVIWLIKKDESPFVDAHGKEALNFQISMTIYGLIAAVLCLVLIGFVLVIVVLIVDLVCTIIAAVEANKGNFYQYPMSIRLIT